MKSAPENPPRDFDKLEAAARTVQEMNGGDLFGITMRGNPPLPGELLDTELIDGRSQ